MFECNNIKCIHNNYNKCSGECETPCQGDEYKILEYLNSDQLAHTNRCHKYSNLNCEGCPEDGECMAQWEYKQYLNRPESFEIWSIENGYI